MCGFVFTTVPDSIEGMLDSICHRGIRSKYHELPSGWLGHTRLPIQGLSEEFDQPYIYKNWTFAYVGEIFNYKSLVPTAQSDIEVLVKAWDYTGPSIFDEFDGFFSVFAYDRNTNHAALVTDILAKKPVYMHVPTLSLASEIKPLCQLGVTENLLYYSSVAKFGYTTGTPFNEIIKLEPCMVYEFDYDKKIYETYPWTKLKPCPEVNIRKQIENSVKNRLVSDVPISLLLSGGLDSSIIYKLIEKQTHDFTIFHVENEESEFLNCLDIPGDIKIEYLRYDDLDLGDVLYVNEGPVDLGSMLPQYALCRAIKERCPLTPVVITGDGADELFGGYRRMEEYDAQYSDIFEELVLYHLPRLDKMAMAHTLELRSPFLHRKVIEGAMSLSYQSRINKKFLKEIFCDIIPLHIIDRPKKALKSDQVLHDKMWRHTLIRKFKEEIANEYQRRR